MKVADAAAVAGVIAEEFVELVERHRAALHVAIRAWLFEQLDKLVARHRRLRADRTQHALVGQLDDGVAEVEQEPGVFHRYIRKTPNFGASMFALYAIERPRPR